MPATHLLISCAKDEGPFLLEWVAHCPSLGFTRVIAASSDRSDGSDLLLAALGRLGAISHAHAPAPGDAPARGLRGDQGRATPDGEDASIGRSDGVLAATTGPLLEDAAVRGAQATCEAACADKARAALQARGWRQEAE